MKRGMPGHNLDYRVTEAWQDLSRLLIRQWRSQLRRVCSDKSTSEPIARVSKHRKQNSLARILRA